MNAIGELPSDWRAALGPAATSNALNILDAAVATERAKGDVFPAPENVFAALRLTPLAKVRAVIIGQDPYHGPGEAHGLAFSVPAGIAIPPSLRNIRTELRTDLGIEAPSSGSLEQWAENGVLLLNAILTVAKDDPGSHRALGWKPLTTAMVRAVQQLDRPIAFLLWGKFAQKLAGPIPEPHVAVSTAHPSPRSQKGFCGTRPFSTANKLLAKRGADPIDWRLS